MKKRATRRMLRSSDRVRTGTSRISIELSTKNSGDVCAFIARQYIVIIATYSSMLTTSARNGRRPARGLDDPKLRTLVLNPLRSKACAPIYYSTGD